MFTSLNSIGKRIFIRTSWKERILQNPLIYIIKKIIEKIGAALMKQKIKSLLEIL